MMRIKAKKNNDINSCRVISKKEIEKNIWSNLKRLYWRIETKLLTKSEKKII